MRRKMLMICISLYLVTNIYSQTRFFDLCKQGTADEIREAVLNGESLKERDSLYGDTPLLIISAYNTNPGCIKTVIELGASIKERNEYGMNALIYGVRYNIDEKIIKEILETGIDVNSVMENGISALQMATANNPNSEITKLLIEAGANIFYKNEFGYTAILYAARNESEGVINELIQHGASVHDRNAMGEMNVLMTAVVDNINPKVIKLVLQAGANINDVDKTNSTALILASKKSSNQEIILELLAYEPDIFIKDNQGRDALDYMKSNRKLNNTEAFYKLVEMYY